MITKRNLKIKEIKSSLNSFAIFRKNTDLMQKKQQKNIQKRTNQFTITSDSSPSFKNYQEEEELQDNSFFEKYSLIKKIGEGANGTVHLCIHKKSQKQFAVKIFSMDDEHIRELKKNFLFMKQLKHQGIVQYKALYFDYDKRTTYLIMEHLPYPTLFKAKIINEEQLKNIFKNLLDVLQYIHDRKISHRDIKPENILYDHLTKKIKLIDFGISKKTFLRGARRDMLTITGTPFYMAQEVYLGGGYDERIDLWALGVSLYVLIARVTPFESEYHSDTINNILKAEVKFGDKVWDQYSPNLRDLISKLLRPREERITIKNARAHKWLLQDSSNFLYSSLSLRSQNSPSKNQRKGSHNLQNQETEHHEIKKNKKFSFSKEEGDQIFSKICEEESYENETSGLGDDKFLKVIQLMENQEFDLIESDDERFMVSPCVFSPKKIRDKSRSMYWDSKGFMP